MNVKLRYVELDPNKIFNWLDPMNVTCWNAYGGWHDTWWEPETVELRKHFGKIWSAEFDNITGHFSKLEESILKDGIHHPISTASGQLRDPLLREAYPLSVAFTPDMHNDIKNVVYTHTFGGSRLTIAQRHNITVPCIVHDFENAFEHCEEVTIKNYTQWFGDNYRFVGSTPYLRLLRHTHIDDDQYCGMNNETRKAQREATRRSKAIMDA